MNQKINNLRPDGHGWRARLGVLTHDDSAISESELWTMAPAGVSLHTSRIFFADLATYADPPGPENATDLLARLPLQAIIYAWTVGSYLLGTTGEEELLRRVEQHSNGIPVLMSSPAATAAFRALEAERIALIHGPFFTNDFDQKGVGYFRERGFEVVHVSHLMPPVEVPHPNTGSVASSWRRRSESYSGCILYTSGGVRRQRHQNQGTGSDLRHEHPDVLFARSTWLSSQG